MQLPSFFLYSCSPQKNYTAVCFFSSHLPLKKNTRLTTTRNDRSSQFRAPLFVGQRKSLKIVKGGGLSQYNFEELWTGIATPTQCTPHNCTREAHHAHHMRPSAMVHHPQLHPQVSHARDLVVRACHVQRSAIGLVTPLNTVVLQAIHPHQALPAGQLRARQDFHALVHSDLAAAVRDVAAAAGGLTRVQPGLVGGPRDVQRLPMGLVSPLQSSGRRLGWQSALFTSEWGAAGAKIKAR